MQFSRIVGGAAVALSVVLGGMGEAAAQAYPSKPVRMIVPGAAGGPTDTPARVLADALYNMLGQRFVVENRAAGGGIVAGETVARAEPDGYTLLFANSSTLAINPALNRNMPYDPASDLVPVGFTNDSPQILVAHPAFPAKDAKDLVAYAKSNPGKVNFATASNGTLPHLTFELFRSMMDIDVVHVPYASGAPALAAVVKGESDVLFDVLKTRVKTGELKALATTGRQRDEDLPDVPTFRELGIDLTATSWGGVAAPKNTPPAIIALLNAKLNELHASPEFRAKLANLGLVSRGGTPQEFWNWAAEQRRIWTGVVDRMNAAKKS